MSIQQTTNINLIRNQLLQTFTITLNETINALNKRTRASNVDIDIKNALIDIIQNEKSFIMDKLIEPLVKVCSNKEEPTFYESRNGFKADDLLKSDFKTPVNSLNLFNKRNNTRLNYIQTRGFKTDRTQKRENEIYGKSLFRRYVDSSTGVGGNTSRQNNELDSDLLNTLFKKNTRFSELISNTNSSKTQDVDKVKQAFAEGLLIISNNS
jgi:hypothetical protein